MQDSKFKMQKDLRRSGTSRVCILHFAFCMALITFMSAVFTAAQGTSAPQVAAALPTSGAEIQLATIKQYCVSCHNDRTKTAGVSFEGLTPGSIGQHADVFEKAVRKLRGRVMP